MTEEEAKEARKETLKKYYDKNGEKMREASRLRYEKMRAAAAKNIENQ